MTKRLLYLTVCIAAFTIGAYADSVCATGTVDTIAGKTCTIGDKTLTFGNAEITGDNPGNLTTSGFLFIPDASILLAPSFQLVGRIDGAPNGTTLSLQLSASAPGPEIIGLTSSFVGDIPAGDAGGYTIFQGCDGLDCANANAGFASAVCPITSPTCSDSFVPPVSAFVNPLALGGGFNVGYGAQGGSTSASVSSATFTINESTTINHLVPEPTSVVLLGISLIGIFAGRRRLLQDRR